MSFLLLQINIFKSLNDFKNFNLLGKAVPVKGTIILVKKKHKKETNKAPSRMLVKKRLNSLGELYSTV